MRILGIDPGTSITGFGIIDMSKAGKLKYLEAGVIRTKAKQALEKRLVIIYEEVSQLIREFKPTDVAVELLYFSANVTTAMSVSHARGIVLLAAAQADLPVVEYTPLQVKQAMTGYGRADKKQIQEMVKKILNLNQLPKPDDAADALAVAICHSATLTA